MNGANTQGENVADAGGVHESFLAYAKTVAAEGAEDTLPGLDQTVEQLFFLAYAQVSEWPLLSLMTITSFTRTYSGMEGYLTHSTGLVHEVYRRRIDRLFGDKCSLAGEGQGYRTSTELGRFCRRLQLPGGILHESRCQMCAMVI